MNVRQVGLVAHRYLGLALATFLILAGATGAFLPYYHELDAFANPALHHPRPRAPDAVPLSPVALRQKLESAIAGIHVPYVPLDRPPGEAIEFFVRPAIDAATGRPAPLVNDQYFLDPYTGEILGGRMRGDLRQGTKNILPFLYKLHYSLALGPIGRTIFGVVALVWVVDCFVGLYLTFPSVSQTAPTGSGAWWRRWVTAWLVRTGSLFKLTFTWHRASGLWVWGMLLIFAWSAVGLNLGDVYFPTMNAIWGMKETPFETLPRVKQPGWDHALSWEDAAQRGRDLMAAEAKQRGLSIDHEVGISYMPAQGMFRYVVKSSLDVAQRYAGTAVWFDANTAEFREFEAPTGRAAGNTLHAWIVSLHFADIGSELYKVFVCLLGGLTMILSISGVYLWWWKRRARLRAAHLARRATAEAAGTHGVPSSSPPPELRPLRT